MSHIDVYILEDCWGCAEARRLVEELQPLYPDVPITLIDAAPETWPSNVFAVPTYLADGVVFSLGNPSRAQLADRLRQLREADRQEIKVTGAVSAARGVNDEP